MHRVHRTVLAAATANYSHTDTRGSSVHTFSLSLSLFISPSSSLSTSVRNVTCLASCTLRIRTYLFIVYHLTAGCFCRCTAVVAAAAAASTLKTEPIKSVRCETPKQSVAFSFYTHRQLSVFTLFFNLVFIRSKSNAIFR